MWTCYISFKYWNKKRHIGSYDKATYDKKYAMGPIYKKC